MLNTTNTTENIKMAMNAECEVLTFMVKKIHLLESAIRDCNSPKEKDELEFQLADIENSYNLLERKWEIRWE